jgi:hypothetical protein
MISKLFASASVAAMLLFAGSSVHAAMLSDVQGEVLVNSGSGFHAVSGPTTLGLGSTIMVKAGGAAQIAYGDGCIMPATAGGMTLIGATSPCAVAKANMPKPYYNGAKPDEKPDTSPIVTGATPPVEGVVGAAGAGGGLSTAAMIVGGLGLGAMIGGVVIVNAQQKKTPASP